MPTILIKSISGRLPYVVSGNGNYVQCRICQGYFQYLNANHLKTHGWTCGDYQSEFPGAPLQSEEMVKEHMEVMKDYIIPPDLIEQRRIGQLKWWESLAGMERRQAMSDHPIAVRK